MYCRSTRGKAIVNHKSTSFKLTGKRRWWFWLWWQSWNHKFNLLDNIVTSQQPHQRQRAYRPTMGMAQWWWRIESRWCLDRRWPWTTNLASRVKLFGRSSRRQTSHRRWICHQFRYLWWSHHLATWIEGWLCGKQSWRSQNPFLPVQGSEVFGGLWDNVVILTWKVTLPSLLPLAEMSK